MQIAVLEQQGLTKVLLQLKQGLTERDFDAKPIYHRNFLLQKINYIHLNCIRGKWKLTQHWEDYEHSSARFYVKNKSGGFEPVHYEEVKLKELIKRIARLPVVP